jgi:uncharacterized protein (DUF2147 family)
MSIRTIAVGAMLGLGLAIGVQTVQTGQVSAQGASMVGIWLDDEGKGGVELNSCGDSLCGNIIWLKQPNDPTGNPWTDKLNSDSAKRGRPVCGLQIIGGLKKSSDSEWKGGWIYDPEEGKQFDVELTLKDANTLTVFGYAGVKLLGEKLEWKRMPNDTPRCKS